MKKTITIIALAFAVTLAFAGKPQEKTDSSSEARQLPEEGSTFAGILTAWHLRKRETLYKED